MRFLGWSLCPVLVETEIFCNFADMDMLKIGTAVAVSAFLYMMPVGAVQAADGQGRSLGIGRRVESVRPVNVWPVAGAGQLMDACRPVGTFRFSEGEPDSEWRTLLDAYKLDAPGTTDMLRRYAERNQAGMHANEARLLLADIDFFHRNWPEALALYKKADIKGLSRPDRSLYSYRKALCMIKTGFYGEAATELKNVKGGMFDDVRNFYTAYCDYIQGNLDKAYDGFARVKPGIRGLEAGYYMVQIQYTRGEYEEVVEKSQSLMFKNPVPELCAELHRVTGLSYFKLDEYEVARQSLLNYLDQNKGEVNAEALYALGVIEYEDGEYESAAKYLAQVTEDGERGPVTQSAWLFLGQTRLQMDDVQGATLAFEKASAYEADPAVAQTALYDYITAQTRGGNVPFARSAKLLETYLKRWPNSEHAPEVEEYLATAYFNDHNYLKAISTVDAVKNPSEALAGVRLKALYAQGISTATNGDVAASGVYFERASRMKNIDPLIAGQSLLWLGDANYDAGKFKTAASNYKSFLAVAKPSANRTLCLYDLAYAQYRLGSYAEAARNFQNALEARPALTKALADDARIRRADCLYYTGQYAGSQALYDEAINSGAQDSDYAAYRSAMLAGKNAGQRRKIELLEEFISGYPNSKWLSAALLEKALTHEELGEADRAAEAYRRRMGITKDIDIDELLRAAKANDMSGDAPEEQLKLIDRIRHQGNLGADDMAELELYEANALAASGADRQADEILSRLAANPESLVGATAAVTLAQRLNAAQKYQEAYDLMVDFTDNGTPHSYWLAKGFIALADACNGIGRRDLAREYLTSLRDNYPGNEADIKSDINSRLKKLK